MTKLNNVYTLVIVSMLSALSFVGMLIQIPFWMATSPWLKFDLSEIFAILGAIIFGPWIGLLIVGIKNLLHYILRSGDLIGVTMNFFAVGTMVVIIGYAKVLADKIKNESTMYVFIVVGLVVGVVVRTALMIPFNWLAILYTPYKDIFMIDVGFNWEFARSYIYINTTIFNGVQGLVSSVITLPIFVVWKNVIKPSLTSEI